MTARGDEDGEFDLVRQYLHEIGSVRLLTAAQEVELGKRIEAGVYAAHLLREADQPARTLPAQRRRDLAAERRRDLAAVAADGRAAKEHMIRANLRLVVAVASKHRRRGLPLLDAIQNGNLGLIRAVEKFDYTKGYKFSTYATWWIRQAINRGTAETSYTIRLPVHVAEQMIKVQAAERALTLHKGHKPTIEDLAAATGTPTQRIDELRRIGREALSLDAPVGEDGDLPLGELLEDTDSPQVSDTAERNALIADVHAAVATLPPREAQVITLRYGLRTGQPSTLREIADELRISREQARQIQLHALNRLREPDRHPSLLSWAG